MVAPTSVTSPSSTAGSRVSCWALLKRWISSRNRIVGSPLVARRCSARSITSRTSWRPAFTADSSSNAARGVHGDQARERGLARPGRPVEHHRVRPPLLDRRPQRRARLQQVLLAHQLVQRRRAHPSRQRLVGRGHPRLAALGLVLLEEPLHGGDSGSVRRARAGSSRATAHSARARRPRRSGPCPRAPPARRAGSRAGAAARRRAGANWSSSPHSSSVGTPSAASLPS